MIRRTAALLLTMLYTVTAVGFAFNLHYCCHRLVSVTINTPAKGCDMAAKSKCCKNVRLVIKVKDAHHGKSTCLIAGVFGFAMPQWHLPGYFLTPSRSLAINFNSSHPPRDACRSYLKNCVFRV